jgi:hypothetical protein
MVACIDFFEMSEICRPKFIVRHSTSSKIEEQLIEVTRGLTTLKLTATKLKNNRLLDFLNSGKKFLFILVGENNSLSEKAFLQK